MNNINTLADRISTVYSDKPFRKVVLAYTIDKSHITYGGKTYTLKTVVDVNMYEGKKVYCYLLDNWQAIVVGD